MHRGHVSRQKGRGNLLLTYLHETHHSKTRMYPSNYPPIPSKPLPRKTCILWTISATKQFTERNQCQRTGMITWDAGGREEEETNIKRWREQCWLMWQCSEPSAWRVQFKHRVNNASEMTKCGQTTFVWRLENLCTSLSNINQWIFGRLCTASFISNVDQQRAIQFTFKRQKKVERISIAWDDNLIRNLFDLEFITGKGLT